LGCIGKFDEFAGHAITALAGTLVPAVKPAD
jgi:hypothetical protein